MRPVPAAIPNVDRRNVLDTLDLTLKLDKADYKQRSRRRSSRLLSLVAAQGSFKDRALVVVFEGHDAAGKGGAIRRVAMALDPRLYRVYPIAAPTDEEKARPYLWRFWRHVPPHGPHRDLRPLLVRPGPGRAGRGIRERGRSGAGPTARSTISRRS